MGRRVGVAGIFGIGLAVAVHAADAPSERSDGVFLPCPSFAVGNAWRYAVNGDWFRSLVEETVLSNRDGVIVLGIRITTSDTALGEARSPSTPADVTSTVRTIRYDNRTAYTVDEIDKEDGSRRSYGVDPGAPWCGELPRTATYQVVTVADGQTITEEKTVVSEPAGREHVSLPIGAFDTVVVKQTTTSPGVRIGGRVVDSAPTEQELIYAADRVGTVRRLSKVDIMMPSLGGGMPAGGGANDEIGPLLQRGLKGLQNGEDTEAVFEQIRKLEAAASATPAAAPPMSKQQTSIVTELTAYEVK